MNIIKIITKRLVVVLPILLFLLSTSVLKADRTVNDLDIERLNRINNISSFVDLRLTPQVSKSIELYTNKHRKASENLLGRVSIYFPIFENKLRAKSLPDELKYISVIESSLHVDAKSHIGASGLWQFMKSTGKMYGLTVNSAVDERRDVEKATEAALDYLSDLYGMFDDWTLAVAAYNCGPGNVRKAIRKGGGIKDYWEIQQYLPRETQKYVPKFIAAAYLMNYYHDHDLVPVLPEDEVKYTATTNVYEHLSFSELSKETGLELDLIKLLNPLYLKNYIPKNNAGRKLTLPETNMYAFLEARSATEKLLYTNATKYYGRSVTHGASAERQVLASLTALPVGVQRNIFSSSDENNIPDPNQDQVMQASDMYIPSEYIYHKLQKRESLLSLADMYDGVSFEELIQLNNLDFSETPKAGSVIIVKKI